MRSRQREQLLLAASLESKQSFVIDDTNPLPADRALYIERSREARLLCIGVYYLAGVKNEPEHDRNCGFVL